MKTKIGFFSMLLLAGALTVNAQGGGGGGFQRRTPEENTKRVVDTLNSVFKLEQGAQTQVQTIFMDFYKAQNKMMDDMMASGGQMDRDKMRADREKMVADRDEKLKKALSDDQFKKFKSDIEPALSPRRRMGGGGGN
ncbi:MAG: hypothetical protein INR73_24495 [Williamsia sp.]|nr:hypothetical protein [Williamsia sp.]